MRSLQRQASTVCLSAIVSIFGMTVGCAPSDLYVEPVPPQVTVSVPVRQAVTEYIPYTGTTKAEETVELRARVKGFLKEQHFDEKKPVKKDQLLFVIDEEPFQVSLEMANAKLAEANAALKKAEQSKAREVAAATLALDQASLGLALLDERRSRTLLERNAGTRESYDTSEASRRKAEAQVAAGQIGAPPTPGNQDFQYTITTKGRLKDESEFGDIIVKTDPGDSQALGAKLTRVKDVARVELGGQVYDQWCDVTGKAADWPPSMKTG